MDQSIQTEIKIPENIELELEERVIADRVKESFYDMMFACPDDLPQLVRGDSLKRIYVYLTIESIKKWCYLNSEKK